MLYVRMSFEDTIEILEELKDEGVPKNIGQNIDEVILCLKNKTIEKNLIISKALSILEEVTENINLDPMLRTQFLNVSSILEGMLS